MNCLTRFFTIFCVSSGTAICGYTVVANGKISVLDENNTHRTVEAVRMESALRDGRTFKCPERFAANQGGGAAAAAVGVPVGEEWVFYPRTLDKQSTMGARSFMGSVESTAKDNKACTAQ